MSIKLSYNKKTYTIKTKNISVKVTARIHLWPKVKDQIRGYYEKGTNGFIPIQYNKKDKYEKIALIVESPHKDEFDNNFNPLCPLNGSAGKRFANNICNKLDTWFSNIKNIKVEVMIINPVQYQTSLYHFLNGKISYNNIKQSINYTKIDKDIRNETWRFLFNNCSLSNDFITRINTYSPDCIDNCCTGKVNSRTFVNPTSIVIKKKNIKSLKICVRNSIINSNKLTSTQYIEDTHPILW